MTRAPCCESEKEGLKKGPWTPDEDQKLVAYIQQHGHGSWRSLPVNAGLQRCGKSCRLRWTNYLRPDIKRGRFSQEEDQMIVHLHAILGNRWSAIASHLPRRTDNEIKNYWNTHLKKRLLQMGIDPITHKSTSAEELLLDSILPGLRPVVSSNLSHMSQWDCARAEAEARLSRQSSLTSSASNLAPASAPAPHQFQSLNAPTSMAKTPASTSFMSSWKAQVEETLRPSFGLVELDKQPANPVNLQKFLQEWESSLQAPPPPQGFSSYDSPIDVPDLSSGVVSEAVSPQYSMPGSSSILPSSAQITERLMASRHCEVLPLPRSVVLGAGAEFFPLSRLDSDHSQPSFNIAGVCGENDNQFSPTSTLHGPDQHDSSYSSPCVSSNSGSESFDLMAQSFPLMNHHDSVEQARSNMFFPQGASFWSRQQVAMVDALQPEPYFLPEFEVVDAQKVQPLSFNVAGVGSSIMNQVGLPNNIPIPQFDFLC